MDDDSSAAETYIEYSGTSKHAGPKLLERKHRILQEAKEGIDEALRPAKRYLAAAAFVLTVGAGWGAQRYHTFTTTNPSLVREQALQDSVAALDSVQVTVHGAVSSQIRGALGRLEQTIETEHIRYAAAQRDLPYEKHGALGQARKQARETLLYPLLYASLLALVPVAGAVRAVIAACRIDREKTRQIEALHSAMCGE